MSYEIRPRGGMSKEARMHQDKQMRSAMRDMTDNAVQAMIDRDPRCCDPLQGWPMCRGCRWGSYAHAEMSSRLFRRHAPKGMIA